jgi:predicted RNA-binding protein YlxR (DUF448 family)
MARERERRCVVSREVLPEARLVRIAIGPDGTAVPDVAAKLPGRGVWVEARREAVETAVKKNLFARSAGRAVTAPADLADRIEARLAARCLDFLGLARRAGEVVAGFDKVRALVKERAPAHLVEASDGAADGRRKIVKLVRAAWGDVPVAGCFTAAEIGAALGRDATGHAALLKGGAAARFAADIDRLAGFRDIVPKAWADDDG